MNNVVDGAAFQFWETVPHLSSRAAGMLSNMAGWGAGPGPQEAQVMPSTVHTPPRMEHELGSHTHHPKAACRHYQLCDIGAIV